VGDAAPMNPLSLAQLTVNDACGSALIEAAAHAGFDAVGLRVISPAGAVPHPKIAGNDTLLREVEASLKATGLSVLDVNSFWITAQTTYADFLPVLDAAFRLKARHILAVIHDSDVARGHALLAQCCAAAATAGIRIALEFQPYGAVRSLPEAAAIVREAGPPTVGIVVDALHLYRSGGTAADVAALPPETLAFAQFCDAPLAAPARDQLRMEARGRRLYPGEGELPLFDLMDALPTGITLDIETPCERARQLPIDVQAKLACDVTQRFLARWKAGAKQTDHRGER
jgi:sugar phosphate isomerase/epimerase